jgi:anti-sigma factor RsiW
MNHLTEEQFEAILQGETDIPEHVAGCPECQALLAEKRALAERLRQTFTSVRASADLANRIRANVNAPVTKSRPRTVFLATHRRLWSALATAAAILVIAIPVGLYLNTSSQARAAQTELVGIHKQNVESLDELFVHKDPNELAGYLASKTGHAPTMLCPKSGLKVCGCCTRQFRGRTVGSYLVEVQGRPISIVVVPDSPKSLGLTPEKGKQSSKRAVWRARCEGCNMASVRIGDRSYYAVGQVAQENLDSVLTGLLNQCQCCPK